MAKKLIVANWKMNFTTGQASLFLHKLEKLVAPHRNVEIVLCPTTLSLQPLSLQINHRQFKLGAQNCYYQDEGAFTGETSAAMLRGLVKYVLAGHSERRHVFGERDKEIAHKVQAILRNDMQPILCIGETRQERTDGETNQVIHDQVVSGLANVSSEEINQVVIAYEPVWAIGSGEFAKPSDVQAAVRLVRKNITALYGEQAAAAVRVLYGGSVDAGNSDAYLQLPGVDGLLVGGASLKAPVFSKIVDSAHAALTKE